MFASPGTIIQKTRLMAGFCFSGIGLSIELRSISRATPSPVGASAA